MKYKFYGVDCANCSAKLEEKLRNLEYVKEVSLNFPSKTMLIEFYGEEDIEALIEYARTFEFNFDAKLYDTKIEVDKVKEEKIYMFISLAIFIGSFIVDKIGYGYFKYDSNLITFSNILYIISYAIVGMPIIKGAVISIYRKEYLNEKVLMSISTIAAIFIREYQEATAVMLFYTVGEYFQELSVEGTKKSIKDLLRLKENKVHLLSNSSFIDVNLDEVKVGDKIYIKVGERILLDGVVNKGESEVDTSMVTGESLPRFVNSGEKVIAGMINISSDLIVEVKKRFNESTIYKIVEMIEKSAHKKSKVEKIITKFSYYYTPIVLSLAIFVVIIPPLFFQRITIIDSLYNGIVLLVISCPCALVLSIPLTYFSGIERAANMGILIKGANVFDDIEKIKRIYIDKTGTITKGKFEVVDVYEYTDNIEEIYSDVYTLEKSSNHPIAKAILHYLEEKNINICKEKKYKIDNNISTGIKAKFEDIDILIGNKKLLEENNVEVPEIENINSSLVYVSKNGKVVLIFLFKDEIKEDSINFVNDMKNLNIDKLIMLTGDNDISTKEVANRLGISTYYSNLLPEDKYSFVEKYSEEALFIGDGINDAPVISLSKVGVSMGQIGQDITIETSDVVLNTDSLTRIPKMFILSKKLKNIVIQNLVIIMFIKLIVIFFGMFSFVSMWVSVFADVGVTMIAILNSMRIRYMKI